MKKRSYEEIRKIENVKIFICYTSEDEPFRQVLERQLHGARLRRIEWYDHNTSAGMEWQVESERHLRTSQVILFLVSPDFLASDYCYNVLVRQAMEQHRKREALVIPVILRPTHWQDSQFGMLKPLPTNGNPIMSTHWHSQDEAFFDVMEGIFSIAKTSTIKNIARLSSQRRTERSNPLHSPLTTFPKCLCPYCIDDFYPGDCPIISQLDGQVIKPAPDTLLATYKARLNPEPLTSAEYRAVQASRQCPHCRRLLPYNIELVRNISIAIVGDIQSGKTIYLTSLLHQIRERWVKKSQFIKMNCLTQNTEKYFMDQEAELFEHKEQLAPTQRSRTEIQDPVIYELAFRRASKASEEQKFNLIFYDCSGEDQTSQDRMEIYARYVLRASAIIFLIDPYTVTEISNRFPSHLQYPPVPGMIVLQPSHILASTIDLLEDCYGSAAKAYFRSTPLAMMLSKSDLIKHIYAPLVPPFRYLSNFPHPYLDLQDRMEVDTEVRALISETSERPLLELAQHFSKVGFFTTSATGCSADGSGRFAFIDPCRCLDPLLWILHQLKIIPPGRYL